MDQVLGMSRVLIFVISALVNAEYMTNLNYYDAADLCAVFVVLKSCSFDQDPTMFGAVQV